MNARLFLKAIKDNPTDLERRLVYADWLDEQCRYTEAHIVRVCRSNPIVLN